MLPSPVVSWMSKIPVQEIDPGDFAQAMPERRRLPERVTHQGGDQISIGFLNP